MASEGNIWSCPALLNIRKMKDEICIISHLRILSEFEQLHHEQKTAGVTASDLKALRLRCNIQCWKNSLLKLSFK
uniref:Uncharacterized protein n=1 Tax=Oryza glumipatula TaxID=40148 RepID=A0A0D9Z3D2_9ORYZ